MRPIRIQPQPNDDTCGPTALHAVYDYFREEVDLDEVINSVHAMENGGTLSVFLGLDALKRGFNVRLHSYNLKVFDPSWEDLPPEMLRKKLVAQTRFKESKRLHSACLAYSRFIKLGGEIRFDDPTPALLQNYFDNDLPILTGLSATYLYKSKREYGTTAGTSVFDDLRGKPMGHFVVLAGMKGKQVLVADPYSGNPFSTDHSYEVHVGRLINSIMLGIVTYDANLLIISKKKLPV
ncbi:MAG: hypothetical protein IPO90_02565 [Flavobacteriales bacterium]|nr:hypothetical protein [Flavobacteriales bacterium]MBL0043207.1 hypothetical protein [Flavobacteriales bacterium]